MGNIQDVQEKEQQDIYDVKKDLQQVEQIMSKPVDEKKPFDVIYEAVSFIEQALNNDQQDQQDKFILNSIAARLNFDSLEYHKCRQSLSQAEEVYDVFKLSLDELKQIILENQHLATYIYYFTNTKLLILGNGGDEDQKQCTKIYFKMDQLFNWIKTYEFKPEEIDKSESLQIYQFNKNLINIKLTLNLYTHMVYYVAQIFGKLEDFDRSAELCYKVLRLQRQQPSFDKFEFVKNAVDLTNYYCQKFNYSIVYEIFQMCRYEIYGLNPENKQQNYIIGESDTTDCSFQSIEQQEFVQQPVEIKEFELDEIWELFDKLDDRQQETIATYYSELGFFYLQLVSQIRQDQPEILDFDFQQQLAILCDKITRRQMTQISHKQLLQLIQQGLDNFNRAQKYFQLDGWTSDYCRIEIGKSKLYELQTIFTPSDTIRLCKIRIDMFKNLHKELNNQYYIDQIQQMLEELCQSRKQIFDYYYKQLISEVPQIEKLDYTIDINSPVISQCLSSAAYAIEQYQELIDDIEKQAQIKWGLEHNQKVVVKITTQSREFDNFIQYISDEMLEVYVNAVFDQSVIFSKFFVQRKEMMSRALKGFQYCQKVWNFIEEKAKKAFDKMVQTMKNQNKDTSDLKYESTWQQHLDLSKQMCQLMELRISQL